MFLPVPAGHWLLNLGRQQKLAAKQRASDRAAEPAYQPASTRIGKKRHRCNLHLAVLLYKACVHVGTVTFKHSYYTQHYQLGVFALQLVPWTTLPDLNIGRVQAFQAGM